MKTWDVIIIGGGIIGLSLAIELRKHGLRVLIVERGEPGREASHAAAGMLAGSGSEIPAPLRVIAKASAALYPEFVHELEDESGIRVDLRNHGTILIATATQFPHEADRMSLEKMQVLEPALAVPKLAANLSTAYLSERSVDPQPLGAAAVKAAHHRGVDIASGGEVERLLVTKNKVSGVTTKRTSYAAPVIVNCAGAWAGAIGTQSIPVRPVKGQMLAMIGGPRIQHVVRSQNVYLVPRSDGRVVIGATAEEAGYDKRTDINTIQQLLHAAVELVPQLTDGKMHEAWAGLRPGTPDDLPILGESGVSGYFIATGHFRDGILLAPITAQVMASLIAGTPPGYDLTPFSPRRFSN